MKYNLLSHLLLVTIAISGCSKAYVTCTNVEKFQSRSGVFNAPKYMEGQIIVLDTIAKNGGYVYKCNISANGIAIGPLTNTVEILTKTFFSIDLSGKVSRASQDVQAQVKTTINNSSAFFLRDSRRTTVINPSGAVNSDSAMAVLKPIFDEHPNYVCLIVSGSINAKEFSFKINRTGDIDANTQIVKVGDFGVKVKYNCESMVRSIGAAQPSVFFKSTFFGMNSSKTALVPFAANIDLSQYNLINAARY